MAIKWRGYNMLINQIACLNDEEERNHVFEVGWDEFQVLLNLPDESIL